MSTALAVREHVELCASRSFISATEIEGPRRAIECELSRLAARGEVLRVRKGLYWKGPTTRFGMVRPRPLEVALEVAGPGAGPAGVSAAHTLGLTTQVPSIEMVAVPGRCPAPVRGARFVSRSVERRFEALRPLEVAVIEVLRAGPGVVEGPWTDLSRRVASLAERGEIRPDVIGGQLAAERHVAARDRWATIADPRPKQR